jgi:hypothetical protein
MLLGLAALIAFLSGFTDVRLGDIQTVELVIVLAFALSFLQPLQRATIVGPKVTLDILPRILLMFALIAFGSLLSLRLQFYPPTDISFLKQPPVATVSRLLQVMISVSSIFIVALSIGDDPRKLKLVLAAFAWAALLNAAWGLFCVAAYYAGGLQLPGITLASRFPRVSGFFNEGGPLGVYLAGAALVQYVRGPVLRYISLRHFWLSMMLIGPAIIGSQSKAAVLLILLLAALGFLQQRRASLIFVAMGLILPLAVASNLIEGINGYYSDMVNFRAEAYERSEDGNLVNGRLMASVLLPRIIEAHPLFGVGIGNYSLVRNNPDFLLGLPRTENWDLHGLGLLGYLAELGIPLTLYVLYIYAYPLLAALRSRMWIFLLSAYPVLAALLGVQLNFAYPWILMGAALAAISIERKAAANGAIGRPPPAVARRLPLRSPGFTSQHTRHR